MSFTKKEQWLSLIAGGKEKKMARLDEPKVKEALKLVEEVLADSKERELYESRKLAQYDRYCVKKHGEEIGRKKTYKKSSQNLFKMGMQKEQIAQALEIEIFQLFIKNEVKTDSETIEAINKLLKISNKTQLRLIYELIANAVDLSAKNI